MAEKTMEQDMMSMMMVIMMIAVLSQIIPGQVQAAPPTGGNITVSLKNPPSEAELWQLIFTDWNATVAIHQVGGLALVDAAEPIAFEISEGVQFPLRIMSLQVSKWNEDKTAIIVLYEIQSWHPYLWDFDKNDWSEEPDPSYREVFLNAYGHSYFDVDLEAFTS